MCRITVFFLMLASTVNAQEDCIMWPIQNYLDTTSYIFIFEADSLILDDIQMENPRILSRLSTRIAKGRVHKVYQSLSSRIVCSDSLIVEYHNSYAFQKGYSYLLFCGKPQIENHFVVNSCSYSIRLRKSKAVKRRFKEIHQYYYEKEANELMKLFRDD